MSRSTIGIALSIFLMSVSGSSFAGMSYECWSYKGGDLGKMVHVTADDRNQAAQLAADKFKNLSVSFDNVKCK